MVFAEEKPGLNACKFSSIKTLVTGCLFFSFSSCSLTASAFSYMQDLFFRLRARRVDQTFDPDASDRNGIPRIYGRSPSRGDSVGRLVVTDKPAKSRDIITF